MDDQQRGTIERMIRDCQEDAAEQTRDAVALRQLQAELDAAQRCNRERYDRILGLEGQVTKLKCEIQRAKDMIRRAIPGAEVSTCGFTLERSLEMLIKRYERVS